MTVTGQKQLPSNRAACCFAAVAILDQQPISTSCSIWFEVDVNGIEANSLVVEVRFNHEVAVGVVGVVVWVAGSGDIPGLGSE